MKRKKPNGVRLVLSGQLSSLNKVNQLQQTNLVLHSIQIYASSHYRLLNVMELRGCSQIEENHQC